MPNRAKDRHCLFTAGNAMAGLSFIKIGAKPEMLYFYDLFILLWRVFVLFCFSA